MVSRTELANSSVERKTMDHSTNDATTRNQSVLDPTSLPRQCIDSITASLPVFREPSLQLADGSKRNGPSKVIIFDFPTFEKQRQKSGRFETMLLSWRFDGISVDRQFLVDQLIIFITGRSAHNFPRRHTIDNSFCVLKFL